MSLTMKAHGGFNAPWFVVPDTLNAAEQKQYIFEAFGLKFEDVEFLTLVQTFFHASTLWTELVTLTEGGGQPISPGAPAAGTKAPAKRAAAKKAADKPSAPAGDTQASTPAQDVQVEHAPATEAPAADHAHQGVLDELAGAASKKDVMSIFNANKKAFEDADVAAAGKARLGEVS
jgi:hypothetical protein